MEETTDAEPKEELEATKRSAAPKGKQEAMDESCVFKEEHHVADESSALKEEQETIDENYTLKGEQYALDNDNLEDPDVLLALFLQQEFDRDAAYSTVTEKAWHFAEKVATNHRNFLQNAASASANNFSLVAPDDMVCLAERLFTTQEAYREFGKDFYVDVGYHYTTTANMERIRTDGLLTRAERMAANIHDQSNGATFGDGIYTCSNPYSYHKFCRGDQGLFVAQLKGQVGDPGKDCKASGTNTVIGRGGCNNEVCVLQSSAQCVPLVTFRANLIELKNDMSAGNDMVHAYHCSLQEIVDECCNGSVKTPVPMFLPSQVTRPQSNLTNQATINYTAPATLSCVDALKTLIPVEGEAVLKAECSICLVGLCDLGPVVSLAGCSHQLHQSCIENSVKSARRCPLCRVPIGAPQGKMPSGTMQTDVQPDLICSGHAAGTIVITYRIESGRQKDYHENPGEFHGGVTRFAYLPDCQDGRNLQKRLKFAFAHGLTFTVGTSLTTGRPNSVTWASIHHKTSLGEGAHGYPDLGYFINANEELDALDVPAFDDL